MLGINVSNITTDAFAVQFAGRYLTFDALGSGSEQNAPLGRAVIGGLIAATLMTLFVVPAIYSIFSRSLITKRSRDQRVDSITFLGV